MDIQIDNDTAAKLLEDLIALRTDEGEAEGVAYVSEWCKNRAIEHEVQELDGKPLNVIATVGRGDRSIMLNSHIDTVPPGDITRWHDDPNRAVERSGFIYGRGAVDAKGCLAAMMAGFEALAAMRDHINGRVILAAVGGEERGGIGTKLLLERGIRTEAAIVGEPTDLHPVIAHKGCLRLWVTVKGLAAHASRPDLGVNAIDGAAPVLDALRTLAASVGQREDPLTGRASLVVTTIEGGTAINVVPEACRMSLDRRLIPSERYEDALDEIDEALAQVMQRHGIEVHRELHRYIGPSITTSQELVQIVQEAVEWATGTVRAPLGFTATCDMSHLVNLGGIPTLVFGPGELEEAHQYNEKVERSHLALAAKTYGQASALWLQR